MDKPLHVISANHLRNGLNVYYVAEEDGQRWDTVIEKATLYDEDSVNAALADAEQDLARNQVVDCVIVPVDENRIPLTTRERIRAAGPSIKYGHDTR